MSHKFKAVGLSLIVAIAVSAIAVMNASANPKEGEVGGHFFTTGVSHSTVEGHVSPEPPVQAHPLHLILHGLSGKVGCTTQTHDGTLSAETSTSITVIPTYTGCTTTETETAVPIDVNECEYTFTIAKESTDSTEQTAHLFCPTAAKPYIQVTHPNCTVTIRPQTVDSGITYTQKTNATTNKHEVTMDVNVQFNLEKHGLCQFVSPTTGTGTLVGSVTVTAKNTAGDQVHLTRT